MKSVWTLERKQCQAELIQRWQPWKQSTGAKTTEGRNVSRMNALKHGSYAADKDRAKASKELPQGNSRFLNFTQDFAGAR